ncbi:MAG: DUF5715 family protein [Bacteroidales bacterium]|nr:DUF5715 family protein [Bacteroidales bacterium]MCF8391728.1 DUF5715 family protein [Bacteroidales bacterium]
MKIRVRHRKPMVSAAIIIVLLLFYLFGKSVGGEKKNRVSIDYVSVSELTRDENTQLRKYDNSYHLAVALKKGITEAFTGDIKETSRIIQNYGLEKIDDNKYYELPLLTSSLPYLQTDVADFLNILGKRFVTRLQDEGVMSYRFSVTSVLRTEKSQNMLRKHNVNATDNNSSHYYGRTFDISQTRFFERGNPEPIYSYRLRNILLRELIEMQNEGLCYVLLETQTKCIHVTVR